MQFKSKKIIVLILPVIVIAGIWFAYSHSKKTKVVKPEVTVRRGKISQKAEAVGYIKPRHVTTIKSQIGGTVAAIYHYEGEYVTKGEPLIKVNPTPSPANYATAYQTVVKAKSDVGATRKDFLRLQHAFKIGVVSENYSEYINAQQNYAAAKTALKLAEQQLALLKQGKTEIAGKEIANIVVSPIDGYLLTRAVEIGDPIISISAAQASTTLYTIADMNDLMFGGTVDERDAAQIKVGMPATVVIGSMPDAKIQGTLTKIALQSDKESIAQGVVAANSDSDSPFNVGFTVEITKLMAPKTVKLRSGYSATANINIKTLSDVLLLPERVIKFAEGKPYVLVLSADGKSEHKKSIKLGLTDGIKAQIVSGLQLGDKVLDVASGNENNPTSHRPRMRRR